MRWASTPIRSGSTGGGTDRSVVLFPHHIEPFEAILASICQRLARFHRLIFGQIADQVCGAAALNTCDYFSRRAHNSLGGRDRRNTVNPTAPATSDPAKMPTLAKSVSWGSPKARLVTKSDTVNPMPAMAASPTT